MSRLVGVTVVRDEADIIESFARRNLAVLDRLLVLLHRSSDGTREIMAALRSEGLPVRLFEDPSEAFNQSARINSLARRAFDEEGADYVFPLDGDEVLAVESRAALEAALERLPPGMGGLMQWHTYVGTDGDDPAEPCPIRRIGHRFDVGPRWEEQAPHRIDAQRCKVVVGKWFASTPGAWIFEGNHVVFVDNRVAVQAMPSVRNAHFPVRSIEQLSRKGALGWISFLASGQDPEKHGFALHWKQIYERISRGRALVHRDLRDFVALYAPEAAGKPLVADPLPRGDYVLKYTALCRPRPLMEVVLELAERLARSAGAPSRENAARRSA